MVFDGRFGRLGFDGGRGRFVLDGRCGRLGFDSFGGLGGGVAVGDGGLLDRCLHFLGYGRLRLGGFHGYRLRGVGGWGRVGVWAQANGEHAPHKIVVADQIDDPALAALAILAPSDDGALEDAAIGEPAQRLADVVSSADTGPAGGRSADCPPPVPVPGHCRPRRPGR